MKVLSALLLTALSAQSLVVSALPIRWNLGAEETWQDPSGNTWDPDQLATGTSIGECPGPFFWTNLASLVCSRKEWDSDSGDLEIPVGGPGFYEAVLYFSEVGGTIGDRVMNVAVEGKTVYEDLDVVAVTGYPTSYFTVTIKHYITDGAFSIQLNASSGKPALAGIQVAPEGTTPAPVATPPPAPTTPLPSSYYINVGSSMSLDGDFGQTWQSDTITSGSAVNECTTFSFGGLDNGDLLCQYREWPELQSSGQLEFPVAPGTYTLRLYFSETSAAVGERVVDVYIENQLVLKGMDVASRIGGSYGMYSLTVTGFVADGSVTAELRATKGSAVLAAVEITDPNAVPASPTSFPTLSPTLTPTLSPTRAITAPPTFAETMVLPTSTPTKLATLSPTTAPVGVTLAPTVANQLTPQPTNAATTTLAPSAVLPSYSVAPIPLDVSVSPVGLFKLRVNSGSSEPYVDPKGYTWEPDQAYQGGATFSACPTDIISAENDAVYCSERWGNPSYAVAVPSSKHYSVALHFAEIFYEEPGLRVFNIEVNGKLVKQLDIVKEVGPKTAFTFDTIVDDINGEITIDLIGLEENPKISGFEILELTDYIPPTTSPTATPDEVALINCGGGAYTDELGRQWLADSYSAGGSPYSDGNNNVVDTVDDFIFHSERYGEFSYEIPVEDGVYDVILHFAELFWTEPGQRLFNIQVEGSVDFPDVDIVNLGGGQRLTPVVLSAPSVLVADGFLTVALSNSVPKRDNPKISAIEVKRASERRMLRQRTTQNYVV